MAKSSEKDDQEDYEPFYLNSPYYQKTRCDRRHTKVTSRYRPEARDQQRRSYRKKKGKDL